jgi:hypothetical protein
MKGSTRSRSRFLKCQAVSRSNFYRRLRSCCQTTLMISFPDSTNSKRQSTRRKTSSLSVTHSWRRLSYVLSKTTICWKKPRVFLGLNSLSKSIRRLNLSRSSDLTLKSPEWSTNSTQPKRSFSRLRLNSLSWPRYKTSVFCKSVVMSWRQTKSFSRWETWLKSSRSRF